MSRPTNPLALYKLLQKTNCRECMLPSCMAFAVAVIQGQKRLEECPHLAPDTILAVGGDVAGQAPRVDEQREAVGRLKQEMAKIDLAAASTRLATQWRDNRLAVTCLGKDFWVDASGEMSGECHKNLWVQVPVLHYIIHGKGRRLSGAWVAFGELPGATEWNNFFCHRCEEGMRQLADAHGELLFEILHLFGATAASGVTNADQSLLIHPLPNVPMLINYWGPEENFASKLNILFDRTAADNVGIESIYLLARGLVEMFRALIAKHSRDGKLF